MARHHPCRKRQHPSCPCRDILLADTVTSKNTIPNSWRSNATNLGRGGSSLCGFTPTNASFCHLELHPGAETCMVHSRHAPLCHRPDGTIHSNASADTASKTPLWCMTVFGKECTGLMYVQESWGITCAVAAVSPKGRRHQLQVSP